MDLDITMCLGEECPLKRNCIRYVAKSAKLQSYFMKTNYDNETNKCEYFADKSNYNNKYIKEKNNKITV